jgi:hypothetical protein
VTHRTQIARTYASGERAAGLREGTPSVNFADLSLSIEGPSGPVELLAIRNFSESANYAAGDIVAYAGGIYSAPNPVSPGPWNPGSWTSLVADPFSPFVGEAGWDFSVTYTDGNPTEVVFSSGALRVRQTISYTEGDPTQVVFETSIDSGGSYTPAGTLGITYVDGNPVSGEWT